MRWVTHPDDEFLPKQELTEKKLVEILSKIPELQSYTIGEDNEGQLILYTGLYNFDTLLND